MDDPCLQEQRTTAAPVDSSPAPPASTAGEEGGEEEGGVERAVWDALPLFTFGSCRLNRLSDSEVLLTYYAEEGEQGMAAVRCCRFTVPL